MSETGIVRRMDGLGRIVIPKELRRLLGLKAGDETEIAADGDRLTVRRHSRFAGFVTVCGRAVSYAASMTGCEVFLTAADRVEAACGRHAKDMLSRPLTAEFSAFAREEKTLSLRRESGFEPVKGVCIEGELVAVPVRAASGEVAGCLFAVGDNAEGHVGALEFAAGLLGSVCAE